MTEADFAPVFERFERIAAQVKQLRNDIEAGLFTQIAESEPANTLRETPEAYTPPTETLLTDHPHIVRIPGVQGGEPIVRGAYKTVRGIVELTRLGLLPEQIVAEHGPPLTLAHVYDALSYYYDHQEEMEQIFARHKAALEKIRHISQEQQAGRARQIRPKRDGE
jgi:uncharacterized protein (DUF433 family)